MITKKNLTAAAFALLLCLLLTFPLSGPARAEAPGEEINRFNVVLVVDKSGSLRDQMGHGTDPDGLRFDALRLFLGLLTERGNNVGAVVFDEQIRYDSGLLPMDGMEDKKALIRELEYYTPGNDTDIGSAVMRAVELLRGMQEENGLPCLILLFSDGMTDFSAVDPWGHMFRSWATADEALAAAKEEGVTIGGILLNVDGIAERGRIEFQLYTNGTHGAFEEVSRPEDLTAAFRRFYALINNSVYTGAQRVAFSEQGDAELFFTVPSFGVEEVNVVVEGERLGEADAEKLRREEDRERVETEILRPDGELFDPTGHDLDCARYRLVKIPHPHPGIWSVRLRGEPGDWADVTMVYNASMRVTLEVESPEGPYRALTPYVFAARVTDPGVPALTDAQLRQFAARLEVEDLLTGAVREYPLELQNGAFSCSLSFPCGGEYRAGAVLSLGEFELRSENVPEFSVEAVPLIPRVNRITDMLEFGRFRDGDWELELDELFGAGRGSELLYALSDDCGGALTAEDGVLRASLRDAEPHAFTLTASDLAGQSAEIAFELTAPSVAGEISNILNVQTQGRLNGSDWEIGLDELFTDPKDGALTYALSDDCGGAVTLTDDALRIDLSEANEVHSVLTATDLTGQRAEVSLSFAVPIVTARVDAVSDVLRQGRLRDHQWEIGLDELFADPKGGPLTYTLSDDCGGAVTLTDGALRVDFQTRTQAEFSLTATDSIGRQAVVPFRLRLPGPSAAAGEITDTVKTGLFQKNKGLWEQRLDTLFRDPKGTKLTYTLSDDLKGAAQIDGNTLRVNMTGQKKAAFSVTATDEYGLSADVPVTLTEMNMTIRYAMWALLGLAGIAIPIGVILWLRRRNGYD